ncbi:unnamed protein product [Spirodela intermedia]|uniref:Uncharacterized protein n=1 Tax=Spirodela intermedia TaxID=51605 RepID=A0A7I8IWR7_SPIIN|nr:unnamed protein product [Spirodela intermedia]CAA6662221.1 unnamed protein product [Spirodela intermedia]
MQMKKAKQLLKARLCRERQIYEMRKRAELKSAISELERPWEAVERAAAAPNLFSVAADEQLKVLADRFQKPGGFDMWSRSDGPQILRPFDGLPSARFFPKGVVHSLKPYGGAATASAAGDEEDEEEDDELQFDDWVARGKGGTRRTRHHRREGGLRSRRRRRMEPAKLGPPWELALLTQMLEKSKREDPIGGLLQSGLSQREKTAGIGASQWRR